MVLDDAYVRVRMPWTLLQFTDPSSRRVMHDDRDTAERETTVSEGIAVSATLDGAVLDAPRQSWDGWDTLDPATTPEHRKASFDLLGERFRALPHPPGPVE